MTVIWGDVPVLTEDAHDFLDRLAAARDAAVDARCPHGLDVDDCGKCWTAFDAAEERRADR